MAMVADLRRQEEGEGGTHRFNYRGVYRYLITMPVREGTAPFAGREPVLQLLGALRESAWTHEFDIYAYCVLPDQLVMLARGKSDTADMKAFVAQLRTTSNSLLEPALQHPLWKSKYIERVLRKEEESKRIALEMFQMPVKAGLAPSPLQYPFLGSFITSVEKILPPRSSAPVGKRGRERGGERGRSGPPWQGRSGKRPSAPRGRRGPRGPRRHT